MTSVSAHDDWSKSWPKAVTVLKVASVWFFLPLFRNLYLYTCSYSFFLPWELDTTSALELIINDTPGKRFLHKGWAEQEIGHSGFCFVLAWFSCSVALNKVFQHPPFQTRPKLTNQVRSQQCERLIYFDRCFCCRSSLYLLCIEVSEFEQQDLRNTDCCCCSVAQLCPTLCDPMDCSTPGLPVLHHLLELAQTHVHWVSDAIQPARTLSSLTWGAGCLELRFVGERSFSEPFHIIWWKNMINHYSM